MVFISLVPGTDLGERSTCMVPTVHKCIKFPWRPAQLLLQILQWRRKGYLVGGDKL